MDEDQTPTSNIYALNMLMIIAVLFCFRFRAVCGETLDGYLGTLLSLAQITQDSSFTPVLDLDSLWENLGGSLGTLLSLARII